jgi:hypothetical protein
MPAKVNRIQAIRLSFQTRDKVEFSLDMLFDSSSKNGRRGRHIPIEFAPAAFAGRRRASEDGAS